MYKTVFQNEHFIVVDKNACVLTVPSRIGADDERDCLGFKLQEDLGFQIYPVHRLDFEVSGLVIFALNKSAQTAGNSWFEKKEIHKTYIAKTTKLASADKINIGENLIWECLLMKGKRRAYEAQFGKKSITEAVLINIDINLGIHTFYLSPITGRSHQLRFELFRHGYPILGDKLYGSEKNYENGIALRAFKIDLKNCINADKFNLPAEIKINE